ncbi:MAG: hypothetical protein KGI38_02420 [Thaumarchaeota archaeon]|nr:hypothetical protein [Nitrososphaerota archaeon]
MDYEFAAVGFYSRHYEGIFIVYAIPSVLVWYLYLRIIDQQYYFWPIFGVSVLLYLYVRRRINRYCYHLIQSYPENSSSVDYGTGYTDVDLLDSFDIEVLTKINEIREDNGDYLRLINVTSSLIDARDLFRRLSKLKNLNLVRAVPARLALTPSGLEKLSAPRVIRTSKIPPQVGAMLAKAKADFAQGNFNGTVDDINMMFEWTLRDALTHRFGDALGDKWKALQKAGAINPDLRVANLGALLRACRELAVTEVASVTYKLVDSFWAIRNPQKHSESQGQQAVNTFEEQVRSAESSIQIAEAFLRYWFR